MEREDMILVILALIYGSIIFVYTVPKQTILGATPYPEESEFLILLPRLLIMLGVYVATAISAGFFTYWLSKTYFRVDEPIKKKLFLYSALYFGYASFTAGIVSLGIAAFIVFRQSFRTDIVFGLLYPATVGVGTFLLVYLGYYLLVFVFILTDGVLPPKKYRLVLLIIISIAGFLAVFPYNWYGSNPPSGSTKIFRVLTNTVTLIGYLFAFVVTSRRLITRLSREAEPLRKFRLRNILVGNTFVGIFLISYVIDALVGSHYSPYLIAGSIFLALSLFAYYFGINPPLWVVRILRKHWLREG